MPVARAEFILCVSLTRRDHVMFALFSSLPPSLGGEENASLSDFLLYRTLTGHHFMTLQVTLVRECCFSYEFEMNIFNQHSGERESESMPLKRLKLTIQSDADERGERERERSCDKRSPWHFSLSLPLVIKFISQSLPHEKMKHVFQ